MVYGRLDVFWPDGKIETFPLNEETVSVGRSTGNTIVLDTDTISRYHINIGREGSQVFIRDLDSANGTFVDGTRLETGERVPLSGGEEIQIGYLRITFYGMDESPTMPLTTAFEDTQKVERETPEFRLELQPPPIAIAPGSYTSAELVIYNTGDSARTYNVQVTGLPEGWARTNRPMLEILSGDNATVLVNIKPLRRSDSVPGVYNAQISVRLQGKPDQQLEVPFRVTILPYGGFGVALAARRIGAHDPFQLHVHNQGSAPLPIKITGRDTMQQMQFIITPSQLSLAPGQRMQITGEVRPLQRRFFGGAQEYPFDIVVQSMEAARFTTAVRGYLYDKPPLTLWMAAGAGGVLLLAFGLLLFGILALTSRTADPVIERFTVDNPTTQLVQGDLLLLSWQVLDADFISIYVNDAPALENETADSVTGWELSTTGLSGDLIVRLIASNTSGDRTTTATQRVTILSPLTIQTFSVAPTSVVRNVFQTLTISYDVPGALNLSFSGLQGIALSPVPSPTGSSGTLNVDVIPTTDFSLQLNATGEFGGTAQQTLNISLVDPICTANIDTSLYTLPSLTTNVVSSIVRGSSLVVSGRDQAGSWLQIVPPGLTINVWGRRADFTCENTFNVEDLRTVVIDTLPSPSLTLTIASLSAPPLTVVPTTRTALPQLPTGTPPPLSGAATRAATPTVNTSGN